jgi:hypothetical protein
MSDWLQSLLFFRKYLLAEKILQSAKNSRASGKSSPLDNKQFFNMAYYAVPVYYTLSERELLTKRRVIEAVDLLANNKHILKSDNPDFFQVEMICTKAGERALYEGFYKKKIITENWKTIAGIILAASATIAAIVKWVR